MRAVVSPCRVKRCNKQHVWQQEGQKALRALAAKKSSILARIDVSSFQSSTKVRYAGPLQRLPPGCVVHSTKML